VILRVQLSEKRQPDGMFDIDSGSGEFATHTQLHAHGVLDEAGHVRPPWHRVPAISDASTLWYALMRKRSHGIWPKRRRREREPLGRPERARVTVLLRAASVGVYTDAFDAHREPHDLMCKRRTRRTDPRRKEPAAAGAGRRRSWSQMFSYTCLSCGASAYSSANASTVGACPRCSEPLIHKDVAHAVAAAEAPALRAAPATR
jgi:DNA-directed RNA polymerase subunit RPC12/RpoP